MKFSYVVCEKFFVIERLMKEKHGTLLLTVLCVCNINVTNRGEKPYLFVKISMGILGLKVDEKSRIR